jgi:tetratricopeptide (TPR) repeat protein
MHRLAADASLPPKELAALHYALGKAADDTRRYEDAMSHFDEANRLKYQIYLAGKGFDLTQAVSHREKTIAMFTAEFAQRHQELASQSKVPIFIIGMIRSGTTLLEQIVASHPDVGGAGEQRFWVSELPSLIDLDAQVLDSDRFIAARERYLQVLRGLQPDTPRITDKMPMNFYCAGVLHMAFPNAPIIHIKRNPVDTALSIYMTDLAKPPEFAHNKKNIVWAYREYEKIMEFWRSWIPGASLLEVNYEDLVSDQEMWTRRIIDFCGLSWSPACLEFHKSERPVSTPSMWQVRQPIYSSSVEKWRNYEPWLGEFADLVNNI